jgi:diguanylate cyclase (GGDEF)-like protein
VDIRTVGAAREPESARHSAVLMIAAAGVVLAAFTSFGPNAASVLTRTATWSSVVLLLGLAVAVRRLPAERLDRSGAWVAVPLGGVVLICGMNLLTRDVSAAAQAFLAFPVIWCANHLRRAAVTAVTAVALVGDGIVLFRLQPAEGAASDLAFFGTVLVVVAVVLVRAGDEQERLVAVLQQQASIDSLTGLVNRRVLDDALDRALHRPAGSAGAALVLVDVDSFKSINDEHGHPVGDDALVHVASLLRSVVRTGDAVLSRMGGDELAVLLPECAADVAVRRAGEIWEAVRGTPLHLPDGTLLALSVSLGVAHAPSHATGLEELYAAADAALYAAKRGGRDRVAVAGT